MSWQRARKEAQRWIDTLNLATRQMKGQKIDLNTRAADLRMEPKFRAMVIRAAKRILKARGIEALIDEPKPLGQFPDDQDDVAE